MKRNKPIGRKSITNSLNFPNLSGCVMKWVKI